ncbi:MAG: cupin domain-containing protein [Thermoplasmata archaeon]
MKKGMKRGRKRLRQNVKNTKPFITKDKSIIREIISPRNSRIERMSLAEARLSAGCETEEHYHATSEEIYYILEGKGLMRVGKSRFRVEKGDGIVLRPGVYHKIKNTGNGELVFLCICSPMYTHEDTVMKKK